MTAGRKVYLVSVVPPRDKVWTPSEWLRNRPFYVYGDTELKRCRDAAEQAGVKLTVRPRRRTDRPTWGGQPQTTEKENDVGAKEVKAARARLAVTIANEIRANGGQPISEDNPHYQAALKAVNDAVEEVDRANRWWDEG